jgi:hypothetical protein
MNAIDEVDCSPETNKECMFKISDFFVIVRTNHQLLKKILQVLILASFFLFQPNKFVINHITPKPHFRKTKKKIQIVLKVPTLKQTLRV